MSIRIKKVDGSTVFDNFDCGDCDLYDFLFGDSIRYQNELLAVTYLVYDDKNRIIAFFSLSNDSLKDNDFEKWNSLNRKVSNQKRRKDYPAVKLVRLGVDNSQKGKGFGLELIFILKNWFTSDNITGCRFLLVDAYHKQDVLRFYLKNEFDYLTTRDENRKIRLMYFDLIRMKPSK